MSKHVQSSDVSTSDSQGSNKTLLVLGGIALVSVGGFLVYRFVTKEDKKTAKKTVTNGDNVEIVADKTPRETPQTSTKATSLESTTLYNKNLAVTTDYTTWRTWTEPRLGLKFKHPANYEIKMTNTSGDTTLIEMTNPILKYRKDVQVYMMIEDQAHAVDVREYMYLCLVPVENYVGQVHKEVDHEVIINGNYGHEIEYLASRGTKSIRMWSVGVSIGSKTFMFQFTAPSNDKTINIEEIRDIVRSFEFTQVPVKGTSRVRTTAGLSIDLPDIAFLITPSERKDVLLHAVAHQSHRVKASLTITKKPEAEFDTFYSNLEATTPNVKLIPATLSILGTPVQVYRYSQRVHDIDVDYITLCFKHNNVAYVVEASSQSTPYDEFERHLFQSLAGISFENTSDLKEAVLKYTNREKGFSIETPATNMIVKEHSFQSPIVSFMVIPQAKVDVKSSSILMETEVTAADVTIPKDPSEALDKVRLLVKSHLDESSHQYEYKIISESTVKIGNVQAVRFIYSQSEPLSQANMIFFLTCLAKGDKGYFSIKSYTLDKIYTNATQNLFDRIHSSFKFL